MTAAAPARAYERRLLWRVAVTLVVIYAGLVLSRTVLAHDPWQPAEWLILATFVASLAALHLALAAMDLRGDEVMVPLVGLLTGVGLLVKLALEPEPPAMPPSPRWLIYPAALAALAGAAWICRNRVHWIEAAWPLAGLAATGVMVLLLQHGTRFRNAMYGPGLTTPTELLKPLMVVFLAGFLKRRRSTAELILFSLLWLLPQALLVKQHDLGMVVILAGLALSLFYVTTGQTRVLLFGLAAAAMGAVVIYYAGRFDLGPVQHGQRRIELWLHPWADPHGLGHQGLQALFALRGGGLEGMGLGRGLPRSVPLVSSDFVYAALGEAYGWLGCVLLLAAYLALCRRGYRVAALAEEPFRQRLAVGCVTVLAVQTLLNVGGVVRAVPITGITLPFVSHGGSSLLVSCALVGIVLAVGHEIEIGEGKRAVRWPWQRVEYARQDSNLRPSD